MSVEWLIAFTTVSGVGVPLALYLVLRSTRRERTLMREALLDAWRADWLVGDRAVAEGWREIRRRYAVRILVGRLAELRIVFTDRLTPAIARASEQIAEFGRAFRGDDA